MVALLAFALRLDAVSAGSCGLPWGRSAQKVAQNARVAHFFTLWALQKAKNALCIASCMQMHVLMSSEGDSGTIFSDSGAILER